MVHCGRHQKNDVVNNIYTGYWRSMLLLVSRDLVQGSLCREWYHICHSQLFQHRFLLKHVLGQWNKVLLWLHRTFSELYYKEDSWRAGNKPIYSWTSIARTPMARLLCRIRTLFEYLRSSAYSSKEQIFREIFSFYHEIVCWVLY